MAVVKEFSKETLQKYLQDILEEKLLVDKIEDHEQLCVSLSSALSNYPELSVTICETVALLGKSRAFRMSAASSGVLLPSLCVLLKKEREQSNNDDNNKIQLLRAIGNLCFEEDECREQCAKEEIHLALSEMLTQVCSPSSSSSEESIKYRTVMCGCILNLCCGNETLCKLMLELNILEPLSLLLSNEKSETVLTMALHTLTALVDTDCCTFEILTKSTLGDSITHLIRRYDADISRDLLDEVIEFIFATITDEDSCSDWKLYLVKSGCVDVLLSLHGVDLMGKIFTLLMLIMSSDDAMKLLFTNQNLWEVLMSHVMNETLSPNLRKEATSVMANLARTDENCQELIGRGLLGDLSKIIKTTPSNHETIPLLFAVLSVLRNLSIPVSSKHVFLQEGTINDVLYLLSRSSEAKVEDNSLLMSEANVLMKALGCLRLLSTNNDICKYLLEYESLIERIKVISEMFSFPHLKIEGSRLCASLIKHCQDKDLLLKLLDTHHTTAYALLAYLLDSEHNLLKNEGLVALSIAATYNKGNMVGVVLKEEESLVTILKGESTELVENCLTLLNIMMTQSGDEFVKSIEGTPTLLAQLNQLSSHSSENVRKSVQVINDRLKKETEEDR